ncbi:putative quinol monooxygenase [Sphingomonas xinjiangensis]|uniref:Quinol monooxygenase YgiN n=1 Tax=Sphingomonas xinjiangensis TaxID=643568 RepID=A0A840YS81_9SPHN|nr:putative quinol monooxygenase [Sphingomonas xinjiangensis]MBB5712523.1 quinol monooxygenase YgiN [Sphingomonas xinjiangensis]
MNKRLHAIARVLPRPEHLEDAREAIRAIVDRTRAEPGCLEFRVNEDVTDGSLHLYEEWANAEALRYHHEQPYTQHVFRRYEEWLAEPVRLIELTPVA